MELKFKYDNIRHFNSYLNNIIQVLKEIILTREIIFAYWPRYVTIWVDVTLGIKPFRYTIILDFTYKKQLFLYKTRFSLWNLPPVTL